MYLLIYMILLPFGIGVSIGMMYKAYDKKNKFDKEVNDIFKKYGGEV